MAKKYNYQRLTSPRIIKLLDDYSSSLGKIPLSEVIDQALTVTEETDPIFEASPAATITEEDIDNWNAGGGGGTLISAYTYTNVEPMTYLSITAKSILSVTGAVTMVGIGVEEDFSDATHWDLSDVKYDIKYLVIDVENEAGHFEDESNIPISLGDSEADNPFVRQYCEVTLTNEDVIYIADITNDGTGFGDVIIANQDGSSATLPTGTYEVATIYGSKIFTETEGEEEVKYASLVGMEVANDLEFDITQVAGSLASKAIRTIIPATSIEEDMNKVRITLFNNNLGATNFSHVSIGERKITYQIDDWGYYADATPDDTNAPQRWGWSEDTFRWILSGDLSTSGIQQEVVGLTTATDYTIRINGASSVTAESKTLKSSAYYEVGEDVYFYNFTGVDAGTWTLNAGEPTADQIYSYLFSNEDYLLSFDITAPAIVTPVTFMFYSDEWGVALYSASLKLESGGVGAPELFTNADLQSNTLYSLTPDFTGPISKFTFDGLDSIEVPTNEEVVSDWLTFDIRLEKEYLINFDISSTHDIITYNQIEGLTPYGTYVSNAPSESWQISQFPANTFQQGIVPLAKFEYGATVHPENINYPIIANSPVNFPLDLGLPYDGVYDIEEDDDSDCGLLISFDEGNTWRTWFEADTGAPPPYDVNQWVALASNKTSIHGGEDGVWYYLEIIVDEEEEVISIEWVRTEDKYNSAQGALLSLDWGGVGMDEEDFANCDFSALNGWQEGDTIQYAIMPHTDDKIKEVKANSMEFDSDINATMQLDLSALIIGGEEGGDNENKVIAFTSDTGTGLKDWVLMHSYDVTFDEFIIYYIGPPMGGVE